MTSPYVWVYVSSAEKPVRTRRKKPPPREKGNLGGPTDDDPAAGGHPTGSLRYGGRGRLIASGCVLTAYSPGRKTGAFLGGVSHRVPEMMDDGGSC